jgi:antitoxin ParD1/3/4
VDAERNAELMREWLARELQVGIDDHAAGRVTAWDPEALKARGRAALRERGIEP